MNEDYAFIMMVKEKWWIKFRERHEEGKKIHSFVTRDAAPPKSTQFILFYVTKPVGEIAGYTQFIERKVGDPQQLWKMYGSESVLSSEEQYEEFIGSARKVSFVRFNNLSEATNPISLNNLLMFLGIKRLSRKGFYVNKETADKLISFMK
jgi:predicted transcriptional regulator